MGIEWESFSGTGERDEKKFASVPAAEMERKETFVSSD